MARNRAKASELLELLQKSNKKGVSLSERLKVENDRFRRFSRDWIADRGDNLAISWLKDENGIDLDDLPEPEILVEQAMGELEAALEELRGILLELGEETS